MDVSVIVPVFNESEALPQLRARLEPVLSSCTPDYEILFINDGDKN